MNIGIIIAVSEYENTPNNLRGCVKDGQLIKELLEATNKFNKILYLAGNNTESVKVKEELSKLVTENEGNEINELFFYYTGHGDFLNNEFYYILSDFNTLKRKQTSLENSELDNLLRQIAAKLTVKVIDACYSGTEYVKDIDMFSKHLEQSKQHFNNCYFMFSSLNNQNSYQNDNISHFTRSFAKAVLEYESNEIRYKDIVDYISDEFENSLTQTPFFVIQAPLTDKFCVINAKIRNLALLSLTEDNQAGKVSTLSLEEFVKLEANSYCSKKEMLENLNQLKSLIELYKYSDDLINLYNVESCFIEELTVKNSVSAIGKWLNDNENDYFAKVITSTRVKASPKTQSKSQPLLFSNIVDKMLTSPDTEEYISGFELTTDVPFKLIEITAKPKYESLKLFSCQIYYFVSKTEIRFFYNYSDYKEVEWDLHYVDTTTNWQTIKGKLKDFYSVKLSISQIINDFSAHIINPIKARYKLAVDNNLLNEDNSLPE